MIKLTILGEPASKANSRQFIPAKGRRKAMLIKSSKALSYEEDFILQAKTQYKGAPLLGNVKAYIWITYTSWRPDLDESLILDCLAKAGIYKNDRQVKEKHVKHEGVSKKPKAEIWIEKKEG